MRVTHEQIPNTIKFLQIDFPALVLQTAGIEAKDEYWQQVVEQIHVVSEKYNKNGFVDHILMQLHKILGFIRLIGDKCFGYF